MKTNTETYKVLINGDEFHLVSDEAESHVLKAAQKVDEVMQKLVQTGAHTDKRRIAILAALQLASESLHLQDELTSRKQQEDALVSLIERSTASL